MTGWSPERAPRPRSSRAFVDSTTRFSAVSTSVRATSAANWSAIGPSLTDTFAFQFESSTVSVSCAPGMRNDARDVHQAPRRLTRGADLERVRDLHQALARKAAGSFANRLRHPGQQNQYVVPSCSLRSLGADRDSHAADRIDGFQTPSASPSERAATRRAPRGRQPRSPAVGAVPGRDRPGCEFERVLPRRGPARAAGRARLRAARWRRGRCSRSARRGRRAPRPPRGPSSRSRVRGDPEIVRDPPADPGDELTQCGRRGALADHRYPGSRKLRLDEHLHRPFGCARALGDHDVLTSCAAPRGQIRRSRGSPSASARNASRITAGSRHAADPADEPPVRAHDRTVPTLGRGRTAHRDDGREHVLLARLGEPPASIRTSLTPRGPPRLALPCLSGLNGMSMFRTPASQSASITAFT